MYVKNHLEILLKMQTLLSVGLEWDLRNCISLHGFPDDSTVNYLNSKEQDCHSCDLEFKNLSKM